MNQPTKKKSFGKRLARIVIKTLLFLVAFFILLVVLIQTAPVQDFIRKKAVAYLEKKLHTVVQVGKIYVGLPKNIILENIYIEDRQKDTLLFAGKIKVNLNLLRLIFKKDVDFKSIELDNITAKIKRRLPDTTFNFQFIADAFEPEEKVSKDPLDTATSSIAIRSVKLNKTRLIYNDVITGNDMEVWIDHLDTKIDRFDPGHLTFDIPETNISGVNARIFQVKPLVSQEPEIKDRIEAKQPSTLQVDFKEVNLKSINLDYRNDLSAVYALLDLGILKVKSNKIDLDNRIIDLEELSLDNTIAALHLGKKEQARIVVKEAKQEVKTQAEAGWRIQVASLELDNNNLQYDDDNNPRIKNGMDYGHLKAEAFILQMSDLLVSTDSIAGKIKKAAFKEQSGFVLNELRTHFLYSRKEAYLEGLYIKTPGTELKRSVAIQYESVEALKDDIGNMQVDLDLQDSRVMVKDVLTFVPSLVQQPAFADPNTTWYLNSRVTGKVADLQIAAMQVRGLQDTKIDVSGRLTGLPAMKNLYANLVIKNISGSRRDMALFIPKNTLPSSITLPGFFNLTGNIKGNDAAMNADLVMVTDLGDASLKGILLNIGDKQKAGYDARIVTRSLQIGTIIQNPEMLEALSATFTVKGTGFDPETASAVMNGKVHSAMINQYTYRDLTLKGKIADQKVSLDAAIVDPNIHFALNATADLSLEYPAVKLSGMIDSIKLQPLHLANEMMIYRGKIEADFPVTDPDRLEGKLFLTQTLFVQNDQRLQLDTVQLLAGSSDSGRYILFNSTVVNAKLEGGYKLTELGNIFRQAVQPYFALAPGKAVVTHEPYDFILNAYILDNPALKVFVPGLDRMDSVKLESRFSDKTGWTALLKAPAIDMGPNKIRGLFIQAGTHQNAIDLTAAFKKFTSGAGIEVDNTTLTARLADNKIDFKLNIKDRQLRNKCNVNGLFQQPVSGEYNFSINPDSLLLNYDAWTVATGNHISITKGGIHASNLVLSKGGQQLKLNSISSGPNSPMEVDFTNFKLVTLTGFVQSDSTLANGTLNGKITFSDLEKQPVFTGDLTVNDLSIKNDTVGNVHLLVNNKTPDTYFADITLNGRGNDVKLAGNYYVQPNNKSHFDLDLHIIEMPVATAQAFSKGAIRYATGSVNGKFKVTGNLEKPAINGDLAFNKAGFNVSMLNNYFSIDQEKVSVNSEGIRFDQFEIKDSAKNTLIIDGFAATSDFSKYKFNLDIKARNFKALNSTKNDNKLFYGQLYFTTNLKVSGTEELPVVDGRLVVNEKTKMTVVLPSVNPGWQTGMA